MFALGSNARAQERVDSLWTVEVREVVVTATRGPRLIRNVPIPTQIVTAQAARDQGAMRLADLLAEQTGITIVHDEFGAGVQLQGFDSAYTLILIDGEPVVGRSGGTLDLERYPIGEIERIEIVRGPSSSLYGSEALAGVINIITRRPVSALRSELGLRTETHRTRQTSWSIAHRGARLGGRLSLTRYGSSGYDLVPEVPGLTAPEFTDNAVSGRIDFEPRSGTDLSFSGRFAELRQVSTVGYSQGTQIFTFDEDADRKDWSLAPKLVQQLWAGSRLTARGYFTGSSNGYTLLNQELASESSRIDFAEWYRKGDIQLNALVGQKHFLTAGAGYVNQKVNADRVEGGQRTSDAGFVFGQHQWYATPRIQTITSARLDLHSEYTPQLSPKASAMVTLRDGLAVRASVGTGFKAPTFQQLYMDFTNPVAAYSVIGASDIQGAIDDFAEADQIAYMITDPATVGEIKPERSLSFNAGLEWNLGERFDLQTNLFRNHVRDLIETQPIAAKPNGQFVFSYLNLSRIYTQGIETEARWRPLDNWTIAAGYQFLDARDRDVLDRIDAGRVYTRSDGRDRRVTRSDYGGLFHRSRHTGSVRLGWRSGQTSASLRAIYRSRFGIGDRNGNLILDDAAEYVPGYLLLNGTVTHRTSRHVELQIGVKNALDRTFPTEVPSLAGRLLFGGVQFTFDTSKTSKP